MVANRVYLVPPDEPLPRLPVARAVRVPEPCLATSAEAWLSTGGPHHTVLTTAVGVCELTDFADIAGLELLVVDADTTIQGFRKELRWNQASYRLAAGL
jgi:L-arabinose isomerase